MLVKCSVVREISMESLAETLASASPQEFAAFWLKFSQKCDDKKLDGFAEAMAPDFGGAAKGTFRQLMRLIDYHVEVNKRSKND